MDSDYYHPQYHTASGQSGALGKHPSPSSVPINPYQRARPSEQPGGPMPHQQPHHVAYSSTPVDVGYGSRPPAGGPPTRKPDNGSAGSGMPPMLRDYQYEMNPYDGMLGQLM